MPTKQEIRVNQKHLRSLLTKEEIAEKSVQIAQRVIQNFNPKDKICSLFLPIEKLYEVDTYPLLKEIINLGGEIALSVTNFGLLEMRHFLYDENTQIVINNHGIPEPVGGIEIKSTQLDIVFVPLLAVDKQGHRVGYGKGFYDRFLVSCSKSCQFIGLNFFDELTEIEDLNTTDVRLHCVISPKNRIIY